MLETIFGASKVIIGVVHLLLPPGSPRWQGDFENVLRHARQDAEALASGGVNETNAQELLSIADGAIVGTSLKKDGRVSNPVDAARVRRLVKLARQTR